MDDPRIIELSDLLNRLPIVSQTSRSEKFRNVAGISQQISRFRQVILNDKTSSHMGTIFFRVYEEFEYNMEKLHLIAQAIRQCESVLYENMVDTEPSFFEGVILGRVHRHWEHVKGPVFIEREKKCCVCGICQDHIYQVSENVKLLEPHFLRPPETYSADMDFGWVDFIPVCPNCHHILHQIRPWLCSNDVKKILKKL